MTDRLSPSFSRGSSMARAERGTRRRFGAPALIPPRGEASFRAGAFGRNGGQAGWRPAWQRIGRRCADACAAQTPAGAQARAERPLRPWRRRTPRFRPATASARGPTVAECDSLISPAGGSAPRRHAVGTGADQVRGAPRPPPHGRRAVTRQGALRGAIPAPRILPRGQFTYVGGAGRAQRPQ